MYSLYEFKEKGAVLLTKYEDAKNEYEVINKYFKSINKTTENYKFLGELNGMVYRLIFSLTVEGIENEYMVIHNTL